MSIELFDIQAGILGFRRGQREAVTAEMLLETMSQLSIARALIRIAPDDLEVDVPFANDKLYEACSLSGALVPCPVIVPNTAGDLPSEEQQVAVAIAHGAAAAWIRPQRDHWLIAGWLSDRLFKALSDRRMPLYVSAEMLSPTAVAELAERFAELPILYAELSYRDQRILLPLLERFANIHLSTGLNYRVQGGLEQIVERPGPERLLFGTGFPDSEPMAAAMQLLYADITEDQKRLIGSENMERLIGGIQR